MIWWLMSIFNQLKIHFGCFAYIHVMFATKSSLIEMPSSVRRTCFICVSAFTIWFRTYSMMLYFAISAISPKWLAHRILADVHLFFARCHHPDLKLAPTKFKLSLQRGNFLLSRYLAALFAHQVLLYYHDICQVCPACRASWYLCYTQVDQQ